jgi:nucleotide-binding universal stress UspA family protein
MKRILVTTDLSVNSVAGLRFAIQLSTQMELELVYLLAHDLWDNSVYRNRALAGVIKAEKALIEKELESFVLKIYRSMNVKPDKYLCVIHYHFGVINSILDYAVNNSFSFICISTHGAGNVEKLFGTTTGELIKESEIPVLCIPKSYKSMPVGRLLYVSDLSNFQNELEKVIDFGKPINAEILMMHFEKKPMKPGDMLTMEKELEKKFNYHVIFHCEKKDNNASLLNSIDQAVGRYAPSLMVMFTEQDRSFFELIFQSSKTEQYSFRTTVPLLVFNKSSTK